MNVARSLRREHARAQGANAGPRCSGAGPGGVVADAISYDIAISVFSPSDLRASVPHLSVLGSWGYLEAPAATCMQHTRDFYEDGGAVERRAARTDLL